MKELKVSYNSREIAVEETVIRFVFEVFSNTNPPTQIGICSVTLDEILENTLFRDKLELYVPLLNVLDLSNSKLILSIHTLYSLQAKQSHQQKYLFKRFLKIKVEWRNISAQN